ncbi:saccharopine dehydrogenase C-terminal domain-containing protein [Pseudomonas syringae]|uniref:saccharopine dehydrogenase C-terminal domain-containing protein n=1 Tax=Pseudomonas syringae TaxID=317 RepID=UPI00042A1225|nr:saccharopine dehydrogenase C-terminal domain-containing protein [Pseudomonas syringae]
MNGIENIVIVGFGSIAQALMPLLVERYSVKITIFEKDVDATRKNIAGEYGASLIQKMITPKNFEHTLAPLLTDKTFLLNLAVSVSSEALITLAQHHDSLYLDTCIEPWEYTDSQGAGLTSNFSLREGIKEFGLQRKIGKSTAIIAHGANPGFISILLKKALTVMAGLNKIEFSPSCHQDWAILSKKLGIRVIQISERDTQISLSERSSGHFMCTWSVDGLITECLQPAELGWGTHETINPDRSLLNGYAIAMREQGREVLVKSWSPNALNFSGYLLTHNESLSIADYLTIGDSKRPVYRPTVYYAYHPCDQAVDSIALLKNGDEGKILSKEVIKADIVSGMDELGIFLVSDTYKSFWLGSNLSIGKARKMAKYNSATSLQVVSSIIAGMAWAEANPREGLVESEQLDWEFIYDIAEQYWQPIVAQETDWKPDGGRGPLIFDRFRA